MTNYVVADYISQGFINLEDEPRISVKAWKAQVQECLYVKGPK